MTIDLLCVLCFDAQYKMDRHKTFGFVLGWEDELRLLRDTDLCSVFEDVADSRNAVDL
jgi:hypothetical protein